MIDSVKLPKIYEPAQYEDEIYALWEKAGAFKPGKGKGHFSLVAPPPNANAPLHIGYGLTIAVEDILARYNRLRGKPTLFVPGADHAGFETWVVYEKRLNAAGKSRFDFSREDLYKQVWDFVAENRTSFEQQFRRLGASVDWDHFTFTLDDKVVKQAYNTFKKMWDEGLIYRGERLVNFCTFHGTAFADIEVQYQQDQGKLYYIRYPLVQGSGASTPFGVKEVIVATTRPETMLGDTAVAVHPDDKRYKKMVGKSLKLPLVEREIPIIANAMVETEFGTGAVKITPAHDPNDFAVGEAHKLPMISVIGTDGKMTDAVPKAYRSLTVDEARQKVVKDLQEQGFLTKTEDIVHNVGHCYKCGTVIQPLLREQWFVDMQPLAKEAIKALKANKIAFHPAAKQEQLVRYLEGLKDCNISRQISWGIPIPDFQSVDDPKDWVFDDRVDQEVITVKGKTYQRDPDVFDTWFSSSSWPYATLNYPDGEDFDQFYPLSVMETGGEILYPWVSRMIMLGLYVTGKVPFTSVYIHGYVMAEDGSKMSKSVGNVVNLTGVIDRYGSDAMRMGIIAERAPAINRGYDSAKVEGARNFCNKLWNVARFIEGKASDKPIKPTPNAVTQADHWMLSKLQQSTEAIALDLDNYRIAEAYDRVHHLLWDDFADWYIEASKLAPNLELLTFGLETILKLAHPFAPFVTEAIWQALPWYDNLLAVSFWPKVPAGKAPEATTFEEIKTLVSEIRQISAVLHLHNANLYYTSAPFLAEHAELIKRLARLASVREVKAGHGLHLTQTKYKCWLDVDHQTAQQYLSKLSGQKLSQEQSIKQLEARLSNKAYVHQAPPALVEQTREQLEAARQLINHINEEFERFSATS